MSGRRFIWAGVILFFCLCLYPSPSPATPLKTKKGPVLHYIDGKLQVRVQAKLKNPVLEWRFEGEQKQFPMTKDDRRYWEANLESDRGEYRIVEDHRSTPWIPILNQKPSDEKFKVVVYGNNRSGEGHPPIHKNLLKTMKEENPSLVLHTGALVARGGEPRFWDQFFEEGQFLFQSVPLQPVLGTPDRSKTGRFVDYTDMGNNEKSRYYFQYGPVHFIALDTTRNFRPGGKQYQFLLETLKKIPSPAPIIVYFYHPPFSAGVIGGDQKALDHLVPLFEDYGVDLVLSGQEHGYQRIGPINGVLYVVTGGGGSYPTNITPDPNVKKYKSLYHYVALEVGPETIHGKVKGPRGVVEDSFTLDTLANPLPKDQRTSRPVMKRSRRYKYSSPF